MIMKLKLGVNTIRLMGTHSQPSETGNHTHLERDQTNNTIQGIELIYHVTIVTNITTLDCDNLIAVNVSTDHSNTLVPPGVGDRNH